MDKDGNIFMVDVHNNDGLNTTILFDPNGNFLAYLPILGSPKKILIEKDRIYTVVRQKKRRRKDDVHCVRVYSYTKPWVVDWI